MDELIRNLKRKLSIGNNVDLTKNTELIDENKIKETDDVEEITTKLGNIAVQSKSKMEETKSNSSQEIAKPSLSVIQKPTEQPDPTEEEEMAKHEDIIAFYN